MNHCQLHVIFEVDGRGETTRGCLMEENVNIERDCNGPTSLGVTDLESMKKFSLCRFDREATQCFKAPMDNNPIVRRLDLIKVEEQGVP